VVVAVVVAVGSSPPTSSDISSTAPGAATVQRRNLVETDPESDTLSYANPETVYDRLSRTVTWLSAIGQVIVSQRFHRPRRADRRRPREETERKPPVA
jgi:hypothetical protein